MKGLVAFLAAVVGLTAAAAEARMHAPYRGHRIVSTTTGSPIDSPALAGAYSLRKVRSDYAGAAIRIRRASDNVQLDIGFSGVDLNTAAAVTHCAATTCFVAKWYDQSGATRDFVQAVNTLQPAFAFSCLGSFPCVSFIPGSLSMASPSVTQTGIVSFSLVVNRATGTGICVLPAITLNSIKTRSGTAGLSLNGSPGSIVTTSADGVWHAANGVINGASSSFAVDGATVTGSLTGSATSGAPTLNGIAATTCNLTELAVWGNYALTAAEVDALNTSQQTYWASAPLDSFTAPAAAYSFRKLKSTYAGPAVKLRRTTGGTQDINFLGCTGFTGCPMNAAAAAAFCNATTCFIDTWYDQSGNNRHWLQATTANQPQYIANCVGANPCARSATATTKMVAAAAFTPTIPVTLNVVAMRNVQSAQFCYLVSMLDGNSNQIFIDSGNSRWVLTDTAGYVLPAVTEAAWHAATGVINGAGSVMSIDGAETTGTIAGSVVSGAPMGAYSTAATSQCNQTETIIWNGYALTANERTALTANQRSFWGF